MVKPRGALIAVAAAAIFAIGVMRWHASGLPLPVAGAAPAAGPASRKSAEPVPWINLDRLKADRPVVALGKRRNPFQFVAKPEPTPPPTPPPPPGSGGADGEDGSEDEGPSPTPTAPPPSPLPLRFFGVLEPKGQGKIAVILSEQKEILHGREGEVLGGRYKILKIGHESIDVQEVTTGHTERLPLRGGQ
jgi:hypothetical protein